MNQTIVIALILCVAGIPILLILGFVLFQVRKTTENRHKIPISYRISEFFLTLGFALLVGVPIVVVDNLWTAHLMTQPLRTVTGTIEEIKKVTNRNPDGTSYVLSPNFGYTITVEEKNYFLDIYAGDENFSAKEWSEEAVGQQVTLSIYPESILSRVLDFFDRKVWHSGEIYGVMLEDGMVLLDTEAELKQMEVQVKDDWELYPPLFVAGGILTAAGYGIKRKKNQKV